MAGAGGAAVDSDQAFINVELINLGLVFHLPTTSHPDPILAE
jgi:hypothetical protein